MEYTEDDYLMISGIQHFKFCRRQWALIHVEQQWAENVHTAVGKLMHQKVHDPYLTEKRKDTILVRALPVSSRIMGVSGECDLVEFHKCEDGILQQYLKQLFFMEKQDEEKLWKLQRI